MTRHEYLWYNRGQGDGKFNHESKLGVQDQAKQWSAYSGGSVSSLDYKSKYDKNGLPIDDDYGKKHDRKARASFLTGLDKSKLSNASAQYKYMTECDNNQPVPGNHHRQKKASKDENTKSHPFLNENAPKIIR
jgi:hypothetical protein